MLGQTSRVSTSNQNKEKRRHKYTSGKEWFFEFNLKITLNDKYLSEVIFYLQLASYVYCNTMHSFLSSLYEDSNSSIVYT